MSISVTNLRTGVIFTHDGQIYQVLKYEHIKMGRGSANIKVKVRNVKSGAIKQLGFTSGAKVEEGNVSRKELEFVYYDKRANAVVLLDPATSGRIKLSAGAVGADNLKFLRNKTRIYALTLGEEEKPEILSLELPVTVELKIAETGSSFAGNSAGAVTKPATLETGAVIQVPMFIKSGDMVRVNTERGEYVERI